MGFKSFLDFFTHYKKNMKKPNKEESKFVIGGIGIFLTLIYLLYRATITN